MTEHSLPEWVQNRTHDFNAGLSFWLRDEEPQVGQVIRLVDLDPTAGYQLVRIVKVEPRQDAFAEPTFDLWPCEAEAAGPFVYWEPTYFCPCVEAGGCLVDDEYPCIFCLTNPCPLLANGEQERP